MSNWEFLNANRVRLGPFASTDAEGFNGIFDFALPGEARQIRCVARSGGDWGDWEHVSVSFGTKSTKTPSWEIMCAVKDLFWDEEVIVVQFHPPRSQWVNLHPGCLHLWRSIGLGQPLPPTICQKQNEDITTPKPG